MSDDINFRRPISAPWTVLGLTDDHNHDANQDDHDHDAHILHDDHDKNDDDDGDNRKLFPGLTAFLTSKQFTSSFTWTHLLCSSVAGFFWIG